MSLKIRIGVYSAAVIVAFFAINAFAAEISGVRVTEVTNSTATVIWNTDVDTDATINYGLDSAYGTVRYPLYDKRDHSLKIENLDPGTTYHFRVISTDEVGNKSATAGFVFTTAGSQADKIVAQIDKVTDPEAIKQIAEKVKETASDILRPPSILGQPRVVTTSDGARISWTTDRPANSMVHLAPTNEFNAQSADPYPIKQGDSREAVTTHSVDVIGLKPSTEYHFIVASEDEFGLLGTTEDDTFRTKSILPKIGNIRTTRVQEDAATISWNTGDVKAKGTVEYRNLRTRENKSLGDPVFATNHSVRLTGLEFGTRYQAVVTATNEGGESVSSDPFTFLTVRDLISPAIAKVKNESTLFPGEEVKIQTIISWETDEPSLCQVYYMQGLGLQGAEAETLPEETNPLTLHTQVIVGFAPATVYKYWVQCRDESNNESRSEDFVLITPVKEKNIIDVILENFQGTFGWVNNVGK